ncbi:DUF551 domain-containing protein [Klebsiella variicola]
MTKSTITRERLAKIKSWRETYGAGSNVMLPAEEAEELACLALDAMDSEPVKRVNADQMHHVCLEANRHLDKYGAMAKEVNKLLGCIPAQPAPDYPEVLPCPVLLEPGMRFGKGVKTRLVLDAIQRRAEHYAELEAMTPEERAEYDAGIEAFKAMLPQPAPVVPEEKPIPNTLSMYAVDAVAAIAEVKGWNACRAAMLERQLVDHVDEELLITIKTASALDSLPKTGEVQNNNYPAIPDGYVMVPREPTDEMIAAAMNCEDVLFNSDDSFCVQFGNIYEAMLAATLQSPGSEPATVPGKWIPVSERMPEDEQEVLTINRMGHCFVSFFDKHSGLFFDRLDAPAACCIEHVLVTHWMPLPASPQEVK